jgi:ribosomal protein S6
MARKKLTYWTVKQNEDLIDDDLIQDAIDLLQKRFNRMSEYIEEKYPAKKCSECGNKEFDYYHNKAICTNCGNKIDKILEHQEAVKLGCTSRKLYSVIKEVFSIRLAKKRNEQKPKEKDLRNLKYSIDDFNSGEYTQSEIEFLKKRFNELMEQTGKAKGADPMMIRSMVIKELQIYNIERKEAVGIEVDRMKVKDIYALYRDLTSDLQFSKGTRENEDEQDALTILISEDEELNEDLNIDNEFKEFMQEFTEIKKYKKEAKKRREKSGNFYG